MFKIVFSKEAEKDYKHLSHINKAVFQRVRSTIYSLAEDPYQGKLLTLNLKGDRSYRVGPYRILYSIEQRIITVHIVRIAHRREVYR